MSGKKPHENTTIEQTYQGFLRQAQQAINRDDMDEAIGCFTEALRLSPSDASLYNNIGVLFYKKHEYDASESHLRKAIEMDSEYADPLYNLARIQIRRDNRGSALTSLERCIAVQPEHIRAKGLLERVRGKDNKTPSLPEEDRTPGVIDDSLLWSHTDGEDLRVLDGLKILHCPFEIAGNMGCTARFLRALGLDATSVNYYSSWLKYRCDVDLKLNELAEGEARKVLGRFAEEAIETYDIFHFHFNRSLYSDFRDLEILKKKGKKILFSFWGIDMRSPEWYFYNQARFLGHHPPKPYFLNAELYRIHKIIHQYADVMIGPVCIPRGVFVSGIADFKEWSLDRKRHYQNKSGFRKNPEKTYILHAPTVSWKKGSGMIVRLLEACKSEGMPIEILYVSGVEPEKAKEIYANADFAIDQVGNGTFSTFGLEMMGWNIPVLTYQNALWDRIRDYPPVIKITKQNFKDQIRRCVELKDSSEMSEFRGRARSWAISHTEYRTKGIPEYVRMYAALARGEEVPQLVNKRWFEQEIRMQNGEKSGFYRYMLDNRVFDEIGIEVSDFDEKLYVPSTGG